MFTLYTFGDSILDCGHYNQEGLTPGQLLIRNDDRLFPEFRGRDLKSQGPCRLDHRAQDGATVLDLPDQLAVRPARDPGAALITIGGNDLLAGLIVDRGPGIETFEALLDAFVTELPIRPVFLGNVYDPTLGENSRNFLGLEPLGARSNLARLNAAIGRVAARHGHLVDLHQHFLAGDPSWFTLTIEPSLRGASEIRRCFLNALETEGILTPVAPPTRPHP
jgi:acyl-CoA thioesterase-1